ncbi:hypothetical protein BCF44_101888 [Kutzneria buriramensis]|uniref:Uncharacterized protein n=1 Tax=Kutzneria buriramensis TaxID=1045776 RepID=A0A3E0IAW7_9PSEU|nr:hypothetical protein BCF44_101888 [Kutzneria buriramensis]
MTNNAHCCSRRQARTGPHHSDRPDLSRCGRTPEGPGTAGHRPSSPGCCHPVTGPNRDPVRNPHTRTVVVSDWFSGRRLAAADWTATPEQSVRSHGRTHSWWSQPASPSVGRGTRTERLTAYVARSSCTATASACLRCCGGWSGWRGRDPSRGCQRQIITRAYPAYSTPNDHGCRSTLDDVRPPDYLVTQGKAPQRQTTANVDHESVGSGFEPQASRRSSPCLSVIKRC